MIPRCHCDRGTRVEVLLGGEVQRGTVASAHEWIDKTTAEHRKRRIVILDKEVAGGTRWNFELHELQPL